MTVLERSQFEQIRELARDLWGLNLTDRKQQLVSNRLGSFLRKNRQFADVDDYLAHLELDADEEDKLIFFDILSTNVTSFFRDPHHFELLERELYQRLARGELKRPGGRIRIWSAACSTGPEAYSLAMNALECLPDIQSWDLKILATDLSNSAVRAAKEAVYPLQMLADMDPARVRRFFLRGRGKLEGMARVAPRVRELVTVRRLNLIGPWPFQGPFDVIFLRNVMIYFDRPTRTTLVNRMYEVLSPGGLLVVGSAETLSGLSTPLRNLHASCYVKG